MINKFVADKGEFQGGKTIALEPVDWGKLLQNRVVSSLSGEKIITQDQIDEELLIKYYSENVPE